jgi:protein ImuB
MLWLALRFPRLPLDRLGPAAQDGPFALTAVEGNTPRIALANESARTQGVRAGQTVAAALALCDALRLLPRAPAGEADALRALAHVALGFSSHVGLVGNDGLVLEVEASQRLFGGLVPLSRALLSACESLGYASTAAIGPTPAAARLLARRGERRIVRRTDTLQDLIADWPLDLAEIPAAARAGLDGIGVRRFDALLRLPRAELARRFGRELVDWIDRLFGRRPEPVDPFRPPERFASGLELPYAIEHGDALAFPVGRLLRELGAWLTVRQQALQRAVLALRHEGHPPTLVTLGLVRPSADVEHLRGLARAQIERLALPAPVLSLGLEAAECAPQGGSAGDLFAAAVAREDIGRVVERLSSRLGAQAVRRLATCDDHRPERAGTRPPASDLPLPAGNQENRGQSTFSPRHGFAPLRFPPAAKRYSDPGFPDPGFPGAERPLFLLEPAQPLDWWLRQSGGAVDFEGPERIESGWWDGEPAARDYFRVATARGVRLWVYRERPPRDGWFVHGLFA